MNVVMSLDEFRILIASIAALHFASIVAVCVFVWFSRERS